jgi:Cu2+-exporting ATPase
MIHKNSGGSHEEPAQNDDQVKGRYQCPMKCEGEKVYDQPGKCPVCKMNLVPVGENND